MRLYPPPLPLVVVLIGGLFAACGSDETAVPDAVSTEDVVPDGASDTPGEVPDVATDVEGDTSAPDVTPEDVSDGTTDVEDVAGVDDVTNSEDVVSSDVAPASCLDTHAAGERYSAGDNCNYCVCNEDGTESCTGREKCLNNKPPCTHAGVEHAYAERFVASDGCNECVCATSGLACTRRCPGLENESAILLESLDEACGEDETFTARKVLADLPVDTYTGPFLYDRARAFYPETRPDTVGTFRIRYEGGYAVCRIPMPTQPAIDIEAVVELETEDGAFDEGLHTYLRRDNFGFVDAWYVAAGFPVNGLDGDYDPDCLLPAGFAFSIQVDADGSHVTEMLKVCEQSIALPVGRIEERGTE